MADPQKDQKTEQPTPRRKKQLRDEGRIARSPDVGSAIALGGLYLTFRFLLPAMGSRMVEMTHAMLSTLAAGPDRALLTTVVAPASVAILLPPIALAVAFALVAGFGQTGGAISKKALKPKINRLSPKQNIDKFKPKTMAFESLRVVLKAALLIGVLWIPIQGLMGRTPSTRGLSEWVAFTSDAIANVLLWATLLATVIAVVDYTFKRRKLNSENRMSKQEVRDEAKDTDGDPLVRRARKERARELSRNRMITDVAGADVLLVNPIRFAVALKYIESEGAPRVVARGAGKFAQKLRQEAYRNGVTVRQDIPLTRALYRKTRVGHFVPAELYEAVAVVLASVYRRRAQRRVAA